MVIVELGRQYVSSFDYPKKVFLNDPNINVFVIYLKLIVDCPIFINELGLFQTLSFLTWAILIITNVSHYILEGHKLRT